MNILYLSLKGRQSMSYNLKKLIDILTILAKNKQELTKLRINKFLFFIDKYHLQKYGKLVLNDRYISLKLGPVAELTNNILSDFVESEKLMPAESNMLAEYFSAGKSFRGYDLLKLKKESDLKSLSKSEIDAIEEVLGKFKNIRTSELVDLTHKEEAWLKTEQTNEIDYKLFLADLPEDKREFLSEIIDIDEEHNAFMNILCNG